ncbi:MAG: DNA mismatch repair protein MutS [Gammaproteobacteria bacterium]|nr:DNA mismatch repair protein MutS [Gammaproteobacteria bacterium]
MAEDPDDLKYFLEKMADVRKLSTDRAPVAKPRPKPNAPFARDEKHQVLRDSLSGEPGIDAEAEISFCRPGVSRSILRKLRRGKYSIKGELDLHGLNQAQAKAELIDFIAACSDADRRCVRIIHGKGMRSGRDGPVLKPKVYQWLRRMDVVLAYTTARQSDGGSGAVYVLLR